MRTIHWLGAGLSSIYGLNYFSATENFNLNIWVRDPLKVEKNWPARNHVKVLSLSDLALSASINDNDIVVSMLPYTLHAKYAKIALQNNAHFICSSYVSEELEKLGIEFNNRKLSLICEMGLDPGIDHFLTHKLLGIFKQRGICLEDYKLSILSLCGGIPNVPNDFKYKFSWSPAGILRALKNKSSWIENGEIKESPHPWEALKSIKIGDEEFEYYPNRDSSKFISFFNLENCQLQLFLRGSVRLKGWKNAWSGIFNSIYNINDHELESLAHSLHEKYKYKKDDFDRVIMLIQIQAKDQNSNTHLLSAIIDDVGCEKHSSMSKLVCIPIIGCIERMSLFSSGLVRPSNSALELDYFENLLKNHSVKVNFS